MGGRKQEKVEFKSASVLVVGRSSKHDEVVALLGGYAGKDGYRYSDFGGGLDGGSRRYGGRAHREEERRHPHLGAFRELAEELLGLHGDEARSMAGRIWEAAKSELVGGSPIAHRRHLLYVIPAWAIVKATNKRSYRGNVDAGSHAEAPPCKYFRGGFCKYAAECRYAHAAPAEAEDGRSVDLVLKRFRPNEEVSDVKAFPLSGLLACTTLGVKGAEPIAPIWVWQRKGGRLNVFSEEDQVRLEASRSCGQPVAVSSGHATVDFATMTSSGRRFHAAVERWADARLRGPMVGPRGSLATLAAVLQRGLPATVTHQ